ncbi:uncharacterized protein B0H18DRAFT_1013575 [Fomitopsis serialis]|uniref:uncharacterized protein n=1 Tax=Fomitopsis serialis TaxID=139415 RepID=UPI0020080D41|nr:uncharacterized protein B0H18DRAFT_1013575 [Neoantrodia serialis]KAH9923835.1 hypothetical protein B0H18DRAFT_1013575 [Neoantrodia serialis]
MMLPDKRAAICSPTWSVLGGMRRARPGLSKASSVWYSLPPVRSRLDTAVRAVSRANRKPWVT